MLEWPYWTLLGLALACLAYPTLLGPRLEAWRDRRALRGLLRARGLRTRLTRAERAEMALVTEQLRESASLCQGVSGRK